MAECVRDDVNVCQLCGEFNNLAVCGACKGTWYCSKSHQKQDWKAHKLVCKRSSDDKVLDVLAVTNSKLNPDTDDSCSDQGLGLEKEPSSFLRVGGENISPSLTYSKIDGIETNNCTNKVSRSDNCVKPKEEVMMRDKGLQSQTPANVLQSGPSKAKQKKSKLSKMANRSQQQRYYLNQTTQNFDLPPSICELSQNLDVSSSKPVAAMKETSSLETKEQYLLILQSRFNEVSKYVVKCLKQYGICVVDKFLGEATSQEICKEAIQLKTSGIMDQGQLVNGPSSASKNKNIRGDVISWVDGGEPECENIHYLISCMDSVMLQVSKSLDMCKINERTKAMVACYPGKGRGYIRHVDNPNGDGRCVTCIYYLNKDWDIARDGGLLRIFPVGSEQVANITPICDRLLFFWSDRRNPHEVESALRERYAITVWYYDEKERAQALKRHQDGGSTPNSN